MQTTPPPPLVFRVKHAPRAARAGAAIALIVLLSACSSVFGELPAAVGGLPEGTPERPAAPAAYPAVHDMPPPRSAILTAEEQKKAAAELAATRDQQSKRAAAAAKDQ